MTETWRKCLDENKIVGATLTDLSKAFNCLPHDLVVAKLEACGLDTKTLKLMSGCKQCVKIRNSCSLLKLILFDIPHRSILEPIFFNIFMNDIFFLLGSNLHNFADDNTVIAVAETIQDLINGLEVKTSIIIEWMKDNDMIANPNKFKAIVLTKTDHNTAGIKPNSYVVLLSCRTKYEELSLAAARFHPLNLIIAKLNTFKKVPMNFNILHSVFRRISECRSFLK